MCLNNPNTPDTIDLTFITNLLKVKQQFTPPYCHPINLCNVLMKLITKCKYNRLTNFLPHIIH